MELLVHQAIVDRFNSDPHFALKMTLEVAALLGMREQPLCLDRASAAVGKRLPPRTGMTRKEPRLHQRD
jgi:hypothetical protein